jgi:hypothetical protein
MAPASIAAGQRVTESRRELHRAVRRLEASVSRPSSLLAAMAVGAVVGLSLNRPRGASLLARTLALAATEYVRYRTDRARAIAEHAAVSAITPQIRTLQRALEDCDGEAELARLLGVSVALLSAWLSGQDAVPTNIYVRALDLVATGR